MGWGTFDNFCYILIILPVVCRNELFYSNTANAQACHKIYCNSGGLSYWNTSFGETERPMDDLSMAFGTYKFIGYNYIDWVLFMVIQSAKH